MPVEVIMPKVDMDMASGKVMAWHVAPGEAVERGAPLFDIETDKAAMEVEAPEGGILQHPVAEGTVVAIGQPVAWLYAPGEAVGEPPARPEETAAPAAARASRPAAKAPAVGIERAEPERQDKPRATPLARALAREAGLDLSNIAGSGPRGRIQSGDVRSSHDLRPSPASASLPRFSDEAGPLAVTRRRGGTGTPVLLIHGFASDSLSWAPLEAELEGPPVIRIDLPCHGKSPKRHLAGFAALAAELRQAFDALNLDRVHLIGHSLGGALALAIADTRAGQVESLSLIAPAGLGPEIDGAVLAGICSATRPESLAPWLRRLVADERLITDAYVRLAMASRADPALRAAQMALADALFPDGVQAFDLRAALERLEMPARILWGRRDAIIPWRQALRAPGHVALHLLEGLGHMPQVEAPERVGRICRSYL